MICLAVNNHSEKKNHKFYFVSLGNFFMATTISSPLKNHLHIYLICDMIGIVTDSSLNNASNSLHCLKFP